MTDRKTFTVSEINRYIKGKLQVDPHLNHLWVGGELSNFKWHRSGHMYFTLKDARSSLRCVFFRGYNQGCPFLPSDGMEVRVKGSISVYEREGLYQLYVEKMAPAGVGSLHLAFEQLKTKLKEEGLFEDRHKKETPRIPRRIALLTSPTGAALQDILTTAQRRFPHVTFYVVECLVQGSRAPEDLVRSLRYVERNIKPDLVVLSRGGGSLEELWAFNSEELARAVFSCSAPVVSAVGHETDFTIADFVADLRASTPTASMEMVLPDREALLNQTGELMERARHHMTRRLSQERQRLAYALGRRFRELPGSLLQQASLRLKELNRRLARTALESLSSRARGLAHLSDRLESLSPLNIMQRGYSYCEDEEGRLVNSARKVTVNRALKIYFSDGRVLSRVEQVELKREEGKNG